MPLDAVREIVAKWRNHRAFRAQVDEINAADPEVLREIAQDFGISVSDLKAIAAQGEGADSLMSRMMKSLGLDPDELRDEMPAVVRDIEIICSRCASKGRCERALADGTAAEHAHEFCPNAPTFDALR